MELIALATIIAAFSGVFLSLLSIIYTKKQNERRVEVNLKFDLSLFRVTDDICDIRIELSAFNSGFHSVALISCEFLVNNEVIDFTLCDSYQDPSNENGIILMNPESKDKLPHALKEGEITVTKINAGELAQVLRRRLKGKIQLSGYYETAQNKIYHSKPMEFNIDNWKMCYKK